MYQQLASVIHISMPVKMLYESYNVSVWKEPLYVVKTNTVAQQYQFAACPGAAICQAGTRHKIALNTGP